MATAPFHVSPELTAIAIAYRNPVTDYIADLVMPRTRPVGKLEFSYTVYDLSAFNRPNTFVGRKGRPNEVTTSSRPPVMPYGGRRFERTLASMISFR